MTQPSKGVAAFLVFFGLMFFLPRLVLPICRRLRKRIRPVRTGCRRFRSSVICHHRRRPHLRCVLRLRAYERTSCERRVESFFAVVVADGLGFSPYPKPEQKPRDRRL